MRQHITQLVRGRRGSAMVEFAVMAPLTVLVVYFTMFLNDLTIFRIQAQGATRMMVFGVADRMGSDYTRAPVDDNLQSGPGSYTMSPVRRETRDLVASVYGDFQAATMDDAGMNPYEAGVMTAQIKSITLTQEDVPDFPGQINQEGLEGEASSMSGFMSFLGNLGAFMDNTYHRAGFNTNGMSRVSVRIQVKNRLLPGTFANTVGEMDIVPPGFGEGITITEELAMVTDSWKLEDGRNVWGKGNGDIENFSGTPGFGEDAEWYQQSPFHRQVGRMWFATYPPGRLVSDTVGGGIWGSVAGEAAQWILDKVPGQPFSPRVVSFAYKDRQEDGMVDLYGLSGASTYEDDTVTKFYTAPMEDDPGDPSDSPYQTTFKARGPYFMGCPDVETSPCEY